MFSLVDISYKIPLLRASDHCVSEKLVLALPTGACGEDDGGGGDDDFRCARQGAIVTEPVRVLSGIGIKFLMNEGVSDPFARSNPIANTEF